MAELPMWVVYDKPVNMPQVEHMARKWVVRGDGAYPTSQTLTGPLSELRPWFMQQGLYQIGRNEGDDPVVVEVWL